MDDEQLPSPAPVDRSRTVGRPSTAASSISILVNVVSVGLGGLYLSTRSITVTAIGAALVALLAVALMLGERGKS